MKCAGGCGNRRRCSTNQRLRARLRAQPFDEVAPGLAVTFSAGVTACLGQGDIDSAIERADRAMYRAKQAGRDRTTIG